MAVKQALAAMVMILLLVTMACPTRGYCPGGCPNFHPRRRLRTTPVYVRPNAAGEDGLIIKSRSLQREKAFNCRRTDQCEAFFGYETQCCPDFWGIRRCMICW